MAIIRHPIPRWRVYGHQQMGYVVAHSFLTGSLRISYNSAPEPTQVGNYVVTQKNLYIGLFVIGLPILYIAGPLSTLFWLVGASAFMIIAHAVLLEPGVESEYASVQDTV
jgi:hypothetical protein